MSATTQSESQCSSCGKKQRSLCAACSGHFEQKAENERMVEALKIALDALEHLSGGGTATWARRALLDARAALEEPKP